MKFTVEVTTCYIKARCPLCGDWLETGGVETSIIYGDGSPGVLCLKCDKTARKGDKETIVKRMLSHAANFEKFAKNLRSTTKEDFEFPSQEEYQRKENEYNSLCIERTGRSLAEQSEIQGIPF